MRPSGCSEGLWRGGRGGGAGKLGTDIGQVAKLMLIRFYLNPAYFLQVLEAARNLDSSS